MKRFKEFVVEQLDPKYLKDLKPLEGTKSGASAFGPKSLTMPGPTSSPGANDPLPSWESPSPSARGLNPRVDAEGGKKKRKK